MKAQQAIQQQLAMWHGVLQGIMADCSSEVLDKQLPGAQITSIASIYAHVVFGEDRLCNGMLRGQPTVYESQGWSEKTGVPMPEAPALTPEWAKALSMELPKFQEYAGAVFANTDAYITGLSDDDLDKKLQTPNFGEQTHGWLLGVILATHVPQHTGEIAALKGVQGLKGLPF